MTQDQQDLLIEKALSQPELLTASEADAIMADPGLRQLLSAAALLKAAAQPAPDCDVEAEWQAFRMRAFAQRKSRKTALWRTAAIIVVALGAAAAFIGLRHGARLDNIVLIDTILPPYDTLVLKVNAEPEPLLTAQAPNPMPRHAAKPKADEPDPLVLQARIDNEIALVRAECYRNIAMATDIDFPDDMPAIPDFQIDGNELSFLTAQ